MRIIRPIAAAIPLADRRILNDLKAKSRYRKRMVAAGHYLDSIHRYKLTGNQKDLGEEKTMSGREAHAMNKMFVEIFQEDVRDEIDAGVKFGEGKSVLKRWVVLERNVKESNDQPPTA